MALIWYMIILAVFIAYLPITIARLVAACVYEWVTG